MTRDARMARHGRAERMAQRGAGVPARFMLPRVLLYLCVFALVALGLLMIYSASSVTAAADPDTGNNPAYYLIRQLVFVAVGLVVAGIMTVMDYHVLSGTLLPAIWVATVVLLCLIFVSSTSEDAYGATRWINIGGFSLQPSEFAKLTVILTAANLAHRYFEEASLSTLAFAVLLGIGVGVPLVLIVFQPDKGTMIICAATLVVMGYLAGFSRAFIAGVLVCGAAIVVFLALKDEYSRARVLTALDPWRDPYDTGYQLIQGFYAFGSGGLFGVGVGMSRQKYSYLPMAHNDFIFAVIGEELGLAGTLFVIFLFLLLLWAGYQISRYAPDLTGRLIAAGCTTLVMIQLLVNVGGVLGLIPLTGKPIPFLSYGGSSVMSSLMLMGLVSSVSTHSTLPETVFDARRGDLGLTSEPARHYRATEPSYVGEATPRSARRSTAENMAAVTASPRFAVVGGGVSGRQTQPTRNARSTSPESIRAQRDFAQQHAGGRITTDASGRRRIDLGPSASDRLRRSR